MAKVKDVYTQLYSLYKREFRDTLIEIMGDLNHTRRDKGQYAVVKTLMRHFFPLDKKITKKNVLTKCYATKNIRSFKRLIALSSPSMELHFFRALYVLTETYLMVLENLIKISEPNVYDQLKSILMYYRNCLVHANDSIDLASGILFDLGRRERKEIPNKVKCISSDVKSPIFNHATNREIPLDRGMLLGNTNIIFSSTEIISKVLDESEDFMYRVLPLIHVFIYKIFKNYKYFEITKPIMNQISEKLKGIDSITDIMRVGILNKEMKNYESNY